MRKNKRYIIMFWEEDTTEIAYNISTQCGEEEVLLSNALDPQLLWSSRMVKRSLSLCSAAPRWESVFMKQDTAEKE